MTLRPALTTLFSTLVISLMPLASHAEERLISSDNATTELLVAMGLSDQIVAIDVTSRQPEGKKLPSIGYHRSLSAEGLLAMSPTKVVGSEHMGPEATLTVLEAAGVELLRLPSANTVSQLKSNIDSLANTLDKPELATKLNAQIDAKEKRLENLAASPKRNEQRALFILNTNGNSLRAAGRNTSGEAFLNLLGIKNTVDYENYRELSAEAMLALAPDIIIVAQASVDHDIDKLLAGSPTLALTPAAKKGQIVTIAGAALISGLSIWSLDEALRTNDLLNGKQ